VNLLSTIILIPMLIYISLAVAYNYFLLCVYFFIKNDRKEKDISLIKKFYILIPAHNEELLLGRAIKSLQKNDYPNECYEIIVIADNCDDRTAEIARSLNVKCLVRVDQKLVGKGYALSWALEQLPLISFDAIFIIDADNIVDTYLISELNCSLNKGMRVIQCNNDLANPEESWFTRIIHIARVIDNTFIHYAKQKVGLSSYLMGNGMCFSTEVLKLFPWECYSLSEDYEYYSNLIRNNIYISYNHNAKVFHQESTTFGQAYSQRMRWSRGRFEVIKKHGLTLLANGLKARSFRKVEASFVLLFPQPSLLFNLSMLLLIPSYILGKYWICWGAGIVLMQVMYFVAGLYIAKASILTVISIFYAPFYLIWKGVIDILSFVGFGSKEWKRTRRSK